MRRLDEPFADQMRRILALGRAERKPDPVQTDGVVRADALEGVERPPSAEVVLAVHFQPADARPALENLGVVGGPQADPGLRRDHACCRMLGRHRR